MPKVGFASVAMACATLLGCATPVAPPAARFNCNSGNCTIPVHVDSCVITAPDVDVFGQSRNLVWEIDQASSQAGYSFPELVVHLGVWIKDDPRGQFELPERQTDRKFKIHDKNSDAGKGPFRYGVRVMKGSTACPDLDPSIVNR